VRASEPRVTIIHTQINHRRRFLSCIENTAVAPGGAAEKLADIYSSLFTELVAKINNKTTRKTTKPNYKTPTKYYKLIQNLDRRRAKHSIGGKR